MTRVIRVDAEVKAALAARRLPGETSYNDAIRRALKAGAIVNADRDDADRAFARWCAERNYVEDKHAPHGEGFYAGYEAAS